MATSATSRRLAQLEAKTARGAVVVCSCATLAGRRNLPPGEHFPDCPAVTALPRDVVIKVTYAAPIPAPMAL